MSQKTVPFDIPCVIFAGGKSSRMGEDKSLLPFGGYNTLAEYQYRRLSSLFREVYISAKEAKFDFEADLIEDTPAQQVFAPTAGFDALFKHLTSERVFVLSVDTPFVGEEEITRLLASDRDDLDAVIAKTPSGTHPMCGIYHRSLAPAFETMLKEDNHRLGQLLKHAKTAYVPFENEMPFTNLNHPHEYKEALKQL